MAIIYSAILAQPISKQMAGFTRNKTYNLQYIFFAHYKLYIIHRLACGESIWLIW